MKQKVTKHHCLYTVPDRNYVKTSLSDLKTISKGLFIWEAGRDVCRDGTFFIPGLHENVSTRDDFTWDNLQSQHNIVPAKRDGVFI